MANFQAQVTTVPAIGVAGDFADANPWVTVPAGPGGLVAGAAGLAMGKFGWTQASLIDPDNAPQIVNSFGQGVPTGFVHRTMTGLITTFLAPTSMVLPQGFPATLMSRGNFLVKNDGATTNAIGQKAYAKLSDGSVSFAATGSAATASFTAAIAASTFSVTGSIANNVLTVTAVGSGTVVAGAAISGTGISSGTNIVSQLSGTVGGIGTYAVSIPEQTVASTTVSGTYGTMTVSAMTSGTIAVGGLVGGASANTFITALGTGTGGTGTYIVNNTQTVGSGALTSTTTVETSWVAMSIGAPGEIVKISNW
jgi:hypothetical protein